MLIDLIRKTAAIEQGRRAYGSLMGKRASALDCVLLERAAHADRDLLGIAVQVHPDNVLRAYENLGGSYPTSEEGK